MILQKLKESLRTQSKLHIQVAKVLNQPLVHPLSQKNIIDKLRIDNSCPTSANYLQVHRPDEIKCLSLFRDLLCNDGMNPHKKPYLPENFYIWDKKNTLTKKRIEQFLGRLRDQNDPIIQLGERGVGKTLLQNIILHEYNEQLEIEKIFWVRCDAHKLYELWSLPGIQRADIDIYHKLQFLYVFCKYYDNKSVYNKDNVFGYKSQMFNNIFTELGDSDYNNENFIRHLIKGHYVEYSLTQTIEKFRNDIFISERSNKDSSYMLDNILKDFEKNITNEDTTFSKWIKTSDLLNNYLVENDYLILYIIDGIDNVNFSGNPDVIDNFHILMKNISLNLFKRQNNNYRTYFSMRVDTYNDLRARLGTTTNTNRRYFSDDNIIPIFQEKPENIDDILEKRIDYLLDIIAKGDLKNCETAQILNDIKDIDILHNEFDKYILQMSTRDYLYFHHGMARLILLRNIQRGETFKLSNDIQYNRYFKRNLFLNGKLYMNSEKKDFFDPNEGRFFYNIFYSKPNHQLCTLRILQTLITQNMTRTTLIFFIQYTFGYQHDQINESLKYLESFNLIKPSLINERRIENFDSMINLGRLKYINKSDLIEFSICDKGKQMIEIIFSDIEILYLLSLDTLIPECLLGNHIDSFNNNPTKRSYYLPNCLKSGLTFLNYLRCLDDYERKHSNIHNTKKDVLNPMSPTKLFINTITSKFDNYYSIENLINVDLIDKQIDNIFYRIGLFEEKEKLKEFINKL